MFQRDALADGQPQSRAVLFGREKRLEQMLQIFRRDAHAGVLNVDPQLPLAALRAKTGGADRNRTCDLLIANETLCQLSYDPIHVGCR